MLYSWRFPRYSTPIHWLVHGHMTSNNETVYHQMPWAGNIAQTVTSVDCYPRNVDRCCTSFVNKEVDYLFSTGLTHLFCYVTNHLMTGPLRSSEFCFPRISVFPSTSSSSRETLRFSGNNIHCSPRDQSLSVTWRGSILIIVVLISQDCILYQTWKFEFVWLKTKGRHCASDITTGYVTFCQTTDSRNKTLTLSL